MKRLLLLIILLIPSCDGRMGYDVSASVNGSILEIHRYTQAVNFDVDGAVNGFGNFSKYSSIKGFAGIRSDELSFSTKQGRIGYADKTILRSREGPVVVSAKFRSGANYTSNEDFQNESQTLAVSEHGEIAIDEKWSTYFANQKKIMYSGPLIRFKEAYENNGDIVANSLDSWTLSRESLYRTSINRTLISATLTSQSIDLEKQHNKSSLYLLNLKSIGSKTGLDVSRLDPAGGYANRIMQDYVGQQNMTLKLNMGDWVLRIDDDERGWLECCPSSAEFVDINQTQLYKNYFSERL